MNPDPVHLWYFVACGMLVLTILGAIKNLRRTPPIESEFATKAELKQLREEFREISHQWQSDLAQLRHDITTVQSKNEERTVRTHERVDEILTAVSTLNGTILNLPCLKNYACPTKH